MEQAFLKAEKREHAGSKSAARLRAAGRIPATVYGHKQEPASISINAHDFALQVQHGHRLFDIDIDGKAEKLLVKDIQYDFLGKSVIHVDFIRVDLTERVEVSVGLEFKGVAKGTSEGGIIDEHLSELEIECLVTEIPESIPVNIREFGLGDVLHAGDIQLPTGAVLVTDPEAIILTCHLVAAAKAVEEEEEAAEEEAAEPEVITERKTEEEQESE